MNSLVEKYSDLPRKVVFSTVKTTKGLCFDYDDLIQEAWIKLLECADKFNGKASFETFASKCIRNHIINLLYKETKDRPDHCEMEEFLSTSNELKDIEDADIISKARELVLERPLVRSEYLNEIINNTIDGKSVREISENLDIDMATVYKIIERFNSRASKDERYLQLKKVLEGGI